MKKLLLLSAAAIAALTTSASSAAAQSTWWDWAAPLIIGGQSLRTSSGAVIVLPGGRRDDDRGRRDSRWDYERDDDWDDDWDDDRRRDPRWDRRDRRSGGIFGPAQARRNAGPPFCRNGEGHPVHGRRWCAERGFGIYGRFDPRWERGTWEDIIFRSPRRFPLDTTLRRGSLIDILGSVVLGRIENRGRRLGGDGPIVGRWYRAPRGAAVLQLRQGRVPIAELSDLDRDGRVDLLLLNRGY